MSAPIERSTPHWPEYLWHHCVHEELAEETLYFWRLVFAPTYERDAAVAGIRAAARTHAVRSVVSYELFGVYDLLIRTWLPSSCPPDEFYETLGRELTPAGLRMCDPFAVRHIIRHWAFANGEPRVPEQPEHADLEELLPEEIREVQREGASASRALLQRLTGQHLLSLYQRPAGSPDPEAPGVKFAISIAGSKDLSNADLVTFETEVTRVLDDAESVAERSLYTGSGFGHFLILGRVRHDSFHAIHSELVAQLNVAAIRERFQSRTMTHISGQRGFSIAFDGLSMPTHDTLTEDDTLADQYGGGDGETIDLHALKPGESFRRFLVKAKVDEDKGGFAHVYHVYDSIDKVDRALKVFKSVDPAAVYREMDALRKIEHANVVKLHWGDRLGDCWFIVTDFVDGHTLHGVGPIDPANALEKMIRVLDALATIHADTEALALLRAKDTHTQEEYREMQRADDSALVHRDIKPANIMVSKRGEVKLLDFNIASRVQDPQTTHTGTPEYMLPDPMLGKWAPAHDLFACGVVLYELICGEHPFEYGKPATHLQPIDPRKWIPELHSSLAEVLVRGCAPLAEALYPTAREMRAALEAECADGDLGRTVQTLRRAAGITIDRLARQTGIDGDRITKAESGELPLHHGEALRVVSELSEILRELPNAQDLEPPGA